MSKVTKNERISTLERKVAGLTTMFNALDTWSNYADKMLEELNHALPDPEYDAKCEANEAAVNESLDRHRDRLGLNKPQLKQLDQSVFDGLDEKWVAASVEECGIARIYMSDKNNPYDCEYHLAGTNYDASNWQDSLIERETKELTGSALAKDYFKRGCCPRVCFVGEDDDECLSDLMVAMVIGYVEGKGFETSYNDFFPCAAMVNSYGDELEASEVGS